MKKEDALSDLCLVRPVLEDAEVFDEMMRIWREDGSGVHPAILRLYDGKFDRWLSIVERHRKGKVREGEVKEDVFFIKLDGRLIGAISLRAQLVPQKINGNIAYGIHPKERRKGYGKQSLLLSLKKLNEDYGFKTAVVTCDTDHIVSRRMIESCGGELKQQGYKDKKLMDIYSIRIK